MDTETSTPSSPQLPAEGHIRLKFLLLFVPLSASTVWRRVRQGTFPAPVKLGSRISAWRVADVRAWMEEN